LLFAELWPMRTRLTTAEAAASADKHDRKMTCTNQITLWSSSVPVRRGQDSENSNSNERDRPASTVQSMAIMATDSRLLQETRERHACHTIAIECGQHCRKTVLPFAEFWPRRTRTTMADTDLAANGCDKKVTCTNQITFWAQTCSCSSAPRF